MIRWCIYLRHLLSSVYETLRESGTIKLPSQRTLRDYTHHTKATIGFSKGVDIQLLAAAKLNSCGEREKYVLIVMELEKTWCMISIQVSRNVCCTLYMCTEMHVCVHVHIHVLSPPL